MKKTSNSLLRSMSEHELSVITDRIIHLRQDILQMTQEQFAFNVGISQTYLSQLENKKRKITMSVALQIAVALKINLDWLIYGIGDDKNIFQAATITKESLQSSLQSDVLLSLQEVYSLSQQEVSFFKWMLELPANERIALVKAIHFIRKLDA